MIENSTPMRYPLKAAVSALADGFRASNADAVLDRHGYATDFRQVLLPYVRTEDFVDDLDQGAGKELEGKFRAAHSSSALAVNVFGPFKRHLRDLSLLGIDDFVDLQFERKCPTGLKGTPPNLDIVLDSPERVIGVESKCTEYFSPKRAKFSQSYFDGILDERRETNWFAEMKRLSENPLAWRALDAAQLIKHAFGLANTFSGRKVTLLYLYWEPRDALDHSLFQIHRTECDAFAELVAGSVVEFSHMSYFELWDAWEKRGTTEWLSEHLTHLRRRYQVAIA